MQSSLGEPERPKPLLPRRPSLLYLWFFLVYTPSLLYLCYSCFFRNYTLSLRANLLPQTITQGMPTMTVLTTTR